MRLLLSLSFSGKLEEQGLNEKTYSVRGGKAACPFPSGIVVLLTPCGCIFGVSNDALVYTSKGQRHLAVESTHTCRTLALTYHLTKNEQNEWEVTLVAYISKSGVPGLIDL